MKFADDTAIDLNAKLLDSNYQMISEQDMRMSEAGNDRDYESGC